MEASRHQRTQSLSEDYPSISTEPSTPPQTYSVIVDSPNSIKDQLSIQQQTSRNTDFEPDRRSLHSTGSNSNSKRSWTKRSGTSITRKASKTNKRVSTMGSGGIAGALAASGLAMANATGGPAQHQLSAPQLAPPPQSRKRTSSQTRRSSSPARPLQAEPHNSNNPYQAASHLSSVSQIAASGDDIETDDDTGYDSPDLDLNVDDIPVTGFAVASNKRNADFHELFSAVPEGDYLIEDYGCALQREILIQGRLYISENHVCFHANIFGWITDLVIPMYDILLLEKKMTAFVIPNALQITTRKAKYAFASFLARDTVYDVIHNVWRLARPDVSSMDGGSTRMSADDLNPSTRGSLDGLPSTAASPPARKGSQTESKQLPSQKITHCACGKNGEHYAEKVMECVVPGTPDKVYTLLFASAFMKTFMREEQKLLDIQISDWSPSSSDPKLLSRNMSYIKPLSGGFGPKQTKCELRDETVHLDYEDYVSTVTTTRTPEVPSGGVFAVKTRTCIMWASSNATRVIVSSAVEWTGRSFIKALIEKSAIEGQKQYHNQLEVHLKKYINGHITEFVPEGVLQDAQVVEETIAQASEDEKISDTHLPTMDRKGLQWAWDTFDGAYNVGKRSAKGAIELLKDAWDTSSGTSLLYALVAVLVLSNLYTLLQVGKREEVGRKKAETRRSVERQEWIGDTVKVLLSELRNEPTSPGNPPRPTTTAWPTDLPEGVLTDISELHRALDDIEKRILHLREHLPQ